MIEVGIPVKAWYGDTKETLIFPDDWNVKVMESMHPIELQDGNDIESVFRWPIGTAELWQLARDSKNAVILVDDISRPTPAYRVLPHILEELRKGGITRKDVLIVMAVGGHRQLTKVDLTKKLGQDIVKTVEIICHEAGRDLTYIGKTSRNTRVEINRFVMDYDLKIGVGGITPNPGWYYGGGSKIVLPGVAGFETIRHNHMDLEYPDWAVDLTAACRLDSIEAARMVGLDFIVNTVVNGRREMAGLFVGDLQEAHEAGVRYCEEMYATEILENTDMVIANSYPVDTNWRHAGRSALFLDTVKPGGVKVAVCFAPEGCDNHFLHPAGPIERGNRSMEKSDLVLYSPVSADYEAYRSMGTDSVFYNSWATLMRDAGHKLGPGPKRVAIYPYAAIQTKAVGETNAPNNAYPH